MGTMSPPQVRTIPATMQTRRSPPPLSNPRAASGSLLPDSFPTNIPMASPHSPHPATTPCPHTSVTAHHPIHHHHHCLVELKIATDAPRLLGVRNLGWTLPAQVVQIDLAVSAAEACYSHPTGKVKSSSVSSGVSPHRVPRPPHRHAQPISGSPT